MREIRLGEEDLRRRDVAAVEGVLGVVEPTAASLPKTSTSRALHAELSKLRQTVVRQFGIERLVAAGPAMRRVVAQARIATSAPTPALILGEPGVGKEFLARALHLGSSAGKRAFVPLDCARLPAIRIHSASRR